jgi:hypothetical protein
MMTRGPGTVRASAEYFTCMDIFGVHDRERAAFPRLAAALSRELRGHLLSLSSCVAWSTKLGFYEKLARSPEHHEDLARALLASCHSGYLGSADALGVREVLAQLDLPDRALAAAIEEATRTPGRATVLGALVPGRSTPRPLSHPGSYLVRLDFHTEIAAWLVGSELWYRKQARGVFRAFRTHLEPDDRARSTGHQLVSDLKGYSRLWMEPSGPTSDGDLVRWHAIDGPPGEALGLLGHEIELWAPGTRHLP